MADTRLAACRAAQRHCQRIEDLANSKLSDHPYFRGRQLDFTFEINDGVLTVRGSVPSFYLKQLLQVALKEIDNVARVDNRVDVISNNGLSSEPTRG